MKILIVCQHYYPESFRITDICEELVKRGHSVSVITELPNYNLPDILPEYRRKQNSDEVINGVQIHRCRTIARKSGVVRRILNYYCFALSSKRYAKNLKEEFDVVFVNQLSPIMMAWAGIAYKKKQHKKMLLYCLDLWPESLIAGNIRRGSLLYKYFHRVSEKVYLQADEILVTSRLFCSYFKEHFGISEDKTLYLPQYAEALFTPDDCKKKTDGKIDLMFAGNIGAAQSIPTFLQAAKETRDIKNLYWHFVGDGSELQSCKKLVEELKLDCIIFHGKKPLEEMPSYYAKADAMLVGLMKDPVLSLTLPGKVQTYMAAGKPIIGSADGETEEVIKASNCGYCSPAEDASALALNVRKFCAEFDSSAKFFSDNAVNYYREHFTKERFFTVLEEKLEEYSQ